jgi:hypothetical protein
MLGISPSIERASEPSNTIFPNIGYSPWRHLVLRIITWFSCLVLLIISFILLFFVRDYQKSFSSSCNNNVDTNVNINNDADVNNELCSSSSGISSEILMILSAIITVVVNYTFQRTMYSITSKFEYYQSISHLHRVVFQRIFWSLILNTGYLVLLLNTDFAALLLQLTSHSSPSELPSSYHWFYSILALLPGTYSDFSIFWFQQIGTSIIVTMIFNCANPHFIPTCAIVYDAVKRRVVPRYWLWKYSRITKKISVTNTVVAIDPPINQANLDSDSNQPTSCISSHTNSLLLDKESSSIPLTRTAFSSQQSLAGRSVSTSNNDINSPPLSPLSPIDSSSPSTSLSSLSSSVVTSSSSLPTSSQSVSSNSNSFHVSQTDLNSLYLGRDFRLYVRYAVLLATIFVCFMFSSGMPILWPIAFITCFSMYWCDKLGCKLILLIVWLFISLLQSVFLSIYVNICFSVVLSTDLCLYVYYCPFVCLYTTSHFQSAYPRSFLSFFF